ncbi:DUF4249 family protein [Hymenobacter sp. HMF4947]|uniref:DUF4249 family protein n=1 Tax=Hymenobacter ginkgonis TaxID=2682976 RepID=A0A7K1TDZ7_9BACT|nr:DUF4249 domain-containing protein [Hymenobacter ginkgonis]MVN76620.1 DUF4249 family protein [Hymenobacter ginkgonis]
MNWFSIRYLLLGSALGLGGCVESYTPDVPAATQNYLVVDGFINSQGSTVVKLSRTLGLAATGSAPAEAKATVYIQDNAGTHYPLTESPAGTYASAVQTLPPTRQYQLHIITSKGKEYLSDLVAVKTTPPIDNIEWRLEQDGVQLYVDAHDASNNTRYYRWDYTETWEFTSAYNSSVEFKNIAGGPPAPAGAKYIVPRTENIYNCWRTEISTAIKQTSTTKLAQDVVTDFPLLFLPLPNERLGSKYSILVRQNAQSQAEYDYWEALRKNTENIGTINDPLPSQLTGNVHSLSDATEPVLGYVSAHSVVEKRIFIDRGEFPQGRLVYSDALNNACQLIEVPKDLSIPEVPTIIIDNALNVFRQPNILPIAITFGSGNSVIYTASTPECVDCRLRGTNVKPSFWP